ncbi:ArnT family glycosyltransferase [Aquipuribacter nitratireducens]|uniref:Glycosyltransferase family 39 protein n=1 Tax=Aquipuribacter nitratireducens TaxID=650104 RepID=A0ABW0GMF0_9MICO
MSAPTLERGTAPAPLPAIDPFPRHGRAPAPPSGPPHPPRHARARRRPTSSTAGPLVTRLTVVLSLVVIGAAHATNLVGWPRFVDDEGTYFSQAWAVQELGTLAPYTYWYDHPPVGWLQLAGLTWLPDLILDDGPALLAGRAVMVGYVVVSALLLLLLARRVGMSRGWALATVLVWALNPLTLFWGRQVLLDNVAMPWLLGAFVLALNRRRHLGLHMLAGLAFGIAVLTKETVLVLAPALLVAVWQATYPRTRRFAVVGLGVVTALTGALYLTYAAIRSELLPSDERVSVWAAVQFQLSSREGSGSVLDPSGADGGAHGTVLGWLDQDPYLLLLGIGLSLPALLLRRLRPAALAVVIATLVALRPGGYLPAMYVIAMLPFCALVLVGVVDELWQRMRAGRHGVSLVPSYLLVVVVALMAWQPVQDARERYRFAYAADQNAVHARALEVVEAEVPDDAVLVVDNTYWNDLVAAGRDREDVVWFYKVDSDPAVAEEVVPSYESIDYLLWTRDSMSDMAPVVREAYDNSEVVWSGGVGVRRVELRDVLTQAEIEEREARAASRQRQELALERRALELRLAAPSPYEGLTNGQVDAIRSEAADATPAELADRYGTTTDVVTDVLAETPEETS